MLFIRFALSAVSMISFASLCNAQTTPSDFITPEYEANWGLPLINAASAYALGFTGAGVKIGIADSPVQYSHPEFAGRVYWPTPKPVFPVPGFEIPSHGTHVTGIAAAARNGVGMMGVAFDSTIALAQATDASGYPPAGDWAQELVDAGVSVMNGSFGPPAFPSVELSDGSANPNYEQVGYVFTTPSLLQSDLEDVQTLIDADVVMVFAAGNEFREQPVASKIPSGSAMLPLITPANTQAGDLYRVFTDDSDGQDPRTWDPVPLDDPELANADLSDLAGTMIAVVALTRTGVAGYSNGCGAAADWCIAEPGSEILSTVPMSTYGEKSGTSMASPMAAGGAALVRQAFPYMTARQVIEVLLTTARPIGIDAQYVGHGLLDVGRAVRGPTEFGHPSLIPGNQSIFAPIFAVDTQGYDSVWSNDISGSGGFTKAGAGQLTITGSNTYTGDTTITGGVLQVNGSITASNLTVGSEATLQGVGSVGNTIMSGVLSPGNSVGTLTVDGNLDLAAGSTYLYEIDADQSGDLVVVTGNATIDDEATFELSVEDGVFLDRLYPMIQASTLAGTFKSLHTTYTFVDLDFVAQTTGSGRELSVVAERNQTPMAVFGQTNNQRAVAAAIDGQSAGDEPYNDVILNNDPSQLSGWYQDWSGEIYSANQATLIYNSRLLAQVVNWRLQDSWLEQDETARLQQVGQTSESSADATTVWAQAYGNWDSFGANAAAQKATASSGGFIVGVDHQVTPNLRLGGGFSASYASTSVAASRANTNGHHVLLYGTYDTDAFRFNGGVVQSWYVADVNRTLPLDDQGNASGTVASRSTQLFADLSRQITINKQEDQHTTISPFGQISQTWLNTSNFGETGAEAGLNGQATNASVGFGTLGARLSHQWQTSETSWQASVSAAWQRAWGDRSPTSTLSFATGPDFTVSAAPIAKDAAVIELGIGASLGPSSRLNVVYATTLSGQSSSQMLQARLQWWF